MAILLQDSFNRADNTTTLGSADTGQSYELYGGITWGIYQNQAYSSGSGNSGNGAVIDVGQSDVSISVKTSLVSDSFSCVFRVDTSQATKTGLLFHSGSGALQRFSGSSYTTIGTSATKPVSGDTVKVTAQGSTITVYINGVQKLQVTSTYNQTMTKHGLGNWRGGGNLNGRWDDLLIESIDTGTPTGTDGSTSFDLKAVLYRDASSLMDSKLSLYADSLVSSDTVQSFYQDGSFSADSSQALYADSSFNTDMRNVLYSDSFTALDTKQAIYSDSASAYDTKLSFYQDSATLFDTLQEFFSDGIVGSVPFDLRFVLYADSSALYDSKQAFYSDGSSLSDLAQQFYQVGGTNADIKLVIYTDASTMYDASQTLYSDSSVKADMAQRYYTDGTLDFDTLQAILDDWVQYNEVIQIVLNITRKQTAALDITQRKQSELKM
jgi:hypothetical protein